MSKKVSLKDAFVRSVPSQLAVEPAEQEAVSTETPEAVQPVAAPIQAATYTANPPTSQPVTPLPSYLAPQPTTQPAIQQPSQPAIQPAVQPVNPPPVYTAIHSAVPRIIPKKKATFNLDASLHQRLKVAAAVHSREMVDIVEDALLKYLAGIDHSGNQGIAR